MEKRVLLRFRAKNKDIFEAIKGGRKKVETRAASPKFSGIKGGDFVMLVCGREKMEKKVKKVLMFATMGGLLKRYRVKEINPFVGSAEELESMYFSFPGYRQKIRKYGLIALEME